METVYFSNWVVPLFVSIGLFFAFTVLVIFLALSLTSRKLTPDQIHILKSRMDISTKTTAPEVQSINSTFSLAKKWPYMLLVLIFIGYFTIPPLFQVYLVQVQADRTWILKNCYHITLGKITPDEKRTFEYQKKVLRGRSVMRAFITTDTTVYKTVSNVPDTIYKAIDKLVKK